MENTLTIYGLNEHIAYCEAQGLAKVFQAYADNARNESINSIGFNEYSGYTYIALENGISICSMMGNDVEYLITNMNNGEEHFFYTYDEAETFDPHQEEEEEEINNQ